jgi:hypothetical protein
VLVVLISVRTRGAMGFKKSSGIHGVSDIHWLARDKVGLVAAIFETWTAGVCRWSLGWLLVGGAAPNGPHCGAHL